jgi:hypothetical protein
VEIDNVSFTPSELTVNVGTKVTWTNHDDIPHTATAKGKPPAFDSETLDTDGKFSFTFDQPGIYAYYCKLHPQNRKIYRQITRFRAFDAKQRRVFCTAVRRRLDRARCRIAQTLVAVIFSCSHNSAV